SIASTASSVALLREADGGRAIVVANVGRHPEAIDLELPRPAWRRLRVLDLPGWRSPNLGTAGEGSGRMTLTLPAQSGLVLVEEPVASAGVAAARAHGGTVSRPR
ncbi:MAG: hypothetical protein ACHQ3P_05075, partial [Candidatus Limnocylindrales bacterium]